MKNTIKLKAWFVLLLMASSGLLLTLPHNVRAANPVINPYGVSPPGGSWITWFDFFVTVRDDDDDVMTWVGVELDGTPYAMIENDTSDVHTNDGKDWFLEENGFANGTLTVQYFANDGAFNTSSTPIITMISSGSILKITGGAEDGEIECLDPQYPDCLTYGTADFYMFGFASTLQVGQHLGYSVFQSFISFNTTLPSAKSINYATLFLKTEGDASTDDYENYVYHNTNGTGWWDNSSNLALSDYIPQSAVPSLYFEGNLLNSSHYVDEQYFGLSLNASWINSSGLTRYALLSSQYGTAPSNSEYIGWYSSDTPPHEPYILIDYTPNNPPVITSSCSFETFLEDTLYLRQFSATDADGDPLTWSISGAYWLSINSSSGYVNGTSPGGYQEFTVNVTVSDGTDTDSCVYTIAILPITPAQAQSGIIADFSYTINSLMHEVCFTDLSHLAEPEGAINEIVSWRWDFGDGVGSTERNPTHIYEDPGVYLVMLFIEDDMNTTSFIGKYLFVPPVLQDQFKISPGLPIVLLFIIALLMFFIGLGATILYAYRGEDRTLFKAFVGIMLIIVGTFCLLLIIGIWSLFASLFW